MDNWTQNYSKNKGYFWGWLISLLAFGLMGFWLPILYEAAQEKPISFGTIILQGSLSTFSIVILIEAIITDRSIPKSQRATYPLAVICMILISLHTISYIFCLSGFKTDTLKTSVLFLTCAALFMAIVLYQYKRIDSEESAEEVITRENQEVQDSANKPSSSNPVI